VKKAFKIAGIVCVCCGIVLILTGPSRPFGKRFSAVILGVGVTALGAVLLSVSRKTTTDNQKED